MSDYDDDDFEAAESPQKDASEQPSWLHPLNKRTVSDSDVESEKSPQRTPTSDASIPPTPSSHGTPVSSGNATPVRHSPSDPGPHSPDPPSSDGYSEGDDDIPGPVAPAWTDVKPPKQNHQSTSAEIAELRKRNAELQAAVSAVKEQLAKVAPKLDAGARRKHSAENERMNRLQEEAAHLKAEHARLTKKSKDVDQITALEKQLRERQQELKSLNDRNKVLQVEIRNNAKKLKQMATIEEQRAKMLAAIKQEQKVAQNAALKAERDAELAIQAREGAAERLKALELKDKVPELKPEDVRLLIEMKQTLVSKQETIEALQYRLSVLKRAHESAQRHMSSEPTDTNEIESLRAEVVALRAKLEVGKSNSQSEQPPHNTSSAQATTRSNSSTGQRKQTGAATQSAGAASERSSAPPSARTSQSSPSTPLNSAEVVQTPVKTPEKAPTPVKTPEKVPTPVKTPEKVPTPVKTPEKVPTSDTSSVGSPASSEPEWLDD